MICLKFVSGASLDIVVCQQGGVSSKAHPLDMASAGEKLSTRDRL